MSNAIFSLGGKVSFRSLELEVLVLVRVLSAAKCRSGLPL